MFDWWNKIRLAQRHKLNSQNFSAIEVATTYYSRKQDDAPIKDLEALYLENLRIANIFYEKQDLTSQDYQKLNDLHMKVREIFQQIYPGKSFDRTFVPDWTRDSEIKD